MELKGADWICQLSDTNQNASASCLQVGTFTLFQESYHRETFAKMHVSGPKSDYDHRLLTQVCMYVWLPGWVCMFVSVDVRMRPASACV